jgi:hypothetical protein
MKKMKNFLCVSTKGITSASQFSEALFQTVQEAIHPYTPRRATEWLSQVTLVELYVPWHDPAFRRVEEGCWRMLLLYTVQDFAEYAETGLVIADLPRMLNTIDSEQGREEVLAVCEALQGIERTYPNSFVTA